MLRRIFQWRVLALLVLLAVLLWVGSVLVSIDALVGDKRWEDPDYEEQIDIFARLVTMEDAARLLTASDPENVQLYEQWSLKKDTNRSVYMFVRLRNLGERTAWGESQKNFRVAPLGPNESARFLIPMISHGAMQNQRIQENGTDPFTWPQPYLEKHGLSKKWEQLYTRNAPPGSVHARAGSMYGGNWLQEFRDGFIFGRKSYAKYIDLSRMGIGTAENAAEWMRSHIPVADKITATVRRNKSLSSSGYPLSSEAADFPAPEAPGIALRWPEDAGKKIYLYFRPVNLGNSNAFGVLQFKIPGRDSYYIRVTRGDISGRTINIKLFVIPLGTLESEDELEALRKGKFRWRHLHLKG